MKPNPTRSALLVIDMENGFVHPEGGHWIRFAQSMVPNCVRAVELARSKGIPVFFVKRVYRSDGSDVELTRYPGWVAGGRACQPASTGPNSAQAPEGLRPQPGDYTILKREIRTFDTKSISLGAGFQVRLAAKKYNAGATMDELDAYLTEIREHTVVYFVVDDLVYLKRGGRISSLTAAFGSLLGIKPMISVMPDGSLQSVGKVRGAKRVFSEFVRIMREHNCNVKDYNIEVLQADCPETGDMFVETLKQEFGGDIKVDYQVVGPVIAAHCGPGTLGLIF